jgi:hypothetical protein
MRQYSGTDKRDPHAIQKIDAYLKDASVALGKLEATLPDPDPTWYKGEPGEPGEPGDPGEPGAGVEYAYQKTVYHSTHTPFESFMIGIGCYGNYVYITESGLPFVTAQAVPLRLSTGEISFTFGAYGSGPGQFYQPAGVAVNKSTAHIYVTDMDQQKIQKFLIVAQGATYVSQWGSYGSGNGQLSSPRGIAVDSSGNVYVADFNNDRIQKFTSTGAYLSKWGTPGSGDGQFITPIGVAVDVDDNVYVADFGNNRVQKFNSSGTYILKFTVSEPRGLSVGDDGRVYVSTGSNGSVEVYLADIYVATIGQSGAETAGNFGVADGVSVVTLARNTGVGGCAYLFVSDTLYHTVQLFTQDVVNIWAPQIITGLKTFSAGGAAALNIAVGGDTLTPTVLELYVGGAGTCTLMPGTMMTTVANLGAGDIVIGSAPNVMSALPSSGKDEGDILTISAGVPAWEAPATRLVTQRHEGKTASIASTVLVSKAPPGVYSMYVKLYGLSGSGNVTVTSEWDSGRSTEELVSNFAL